jgi:uncharacterized protein
MIVYASTKSGFIDDVVNNRIEDKILTLLQKRLHYSTSESEIRSWKNSMQYMHTILVHSDVPADAGVAIEYGIPQTSKRVDFILTGQDDADLPNAVIIELKQWEEVWLTGMDGIVETIMQGAKVRTNHPSFQAWSYAALLEDFNETVQTDHIRLNPCAYLHNCISFHVINDPFYREYTNRAPAFLKSDNTKLRSFIEQYVRKGDQGKLIYRIDGGRIRPSKSLADALEKMLNGNQEFLLIDDQKLVYETALALADKAVRGKKQVLIVEGGPGTGKSVVAINLLVELIKREKVVHYVTKNAAPRAVYQSKLTGTFTKSRFDNLFKGSGSYTETEKNAIDVLVVDEAHRLNEKSGMFQNLGDNQIKEIIHTARLSVFFIDENQRVTWKDAGRKEDIVGWAKNAGADLVELELQSQFRCNGSDGYLAWVDHSLQIRDTATTDLEDIKFDFRVFDDPNEMRRIIEEKNLENNKARMVAGYCWDWITQKTKLGTDVNIASYNFSMRWNLKDDGGLWIMKPESVSEIGCIHTCQGLELDYIGVIIGPDLIVRGGKVKTQPEQRSRMDSSIKGFIKALKLNPADARKKADEIIKNTYRTLMTRGQKGCYIFCTDPETNEYFKQAIGESGERETFKKIVRFDRCPFEILTREEVNPFEDAVPVVDLKIAAGDFSEDQWFEQDTWVRLPEPFSVKQGYFVAQVVGNSMNCRIPDGSWCLFRSDPGGSREGKVVLVRHRNSLDPDAGQYTVKVYHSDKIMEDDTWRHARITLKPDSTDPKYKSIVLEPEEVGELKVLGELVAVLG